MAFNIGNVQLTNTFDYWRQRTNDIVAALNSQTVAVNSNTVTGNAVVNGTIQSVTLVANAIGGSATVGASGGVGAAANLNITTNTVHLAPSYHSNVIANGTIMATDANGTIQANSTVLKLTTPTGNTNIQAPTAAQASGGNYYLNANGLWSQVSIPTGVSGTNTQIQFNDSGSLGAVAGFTFNKSSNTMIVANGTISVGYASGNTTLTIAGLQINGTQVVNATSYIGTANNASNLGGNPASSYASNGYLQTQLSFYSNSATISSTYTTQTQLSQNLANYSTSSSIAATYLTQSAASSTYLTQSSAASTYQTQSGMSSYLTTSAASSTYAPKASPTFTGTVYFNSAYTQKIVGIGSTTAVNMDCAQGNYFTATSTGAASATFQNVPAGTLFSVTLKIANGGANTFTWPASVKWPAATAPTLSSNTDFLTFVTDDGGASWNGMITRRDSR